MAQPGRAPSWGGGGRRFKSYCPDQIYLKFLFCFLLVQHTFFNAHQDTLIMIKLPKRQSGSPKIKLSTLNGTYQQVHIDGLTHEGQGVGRINGKAVFVENALPDEIVDIAIRQDHPQYAQARVVRFHQTSTQRTTPFCTYFGQCGGCQLQHLSPEGQRHWKQHNFFSQLEQQLDTRKMERIPPIYADDTAYRRRAKFVLVKDAKTKQACLGFRQAHSHAVIDIASCPILAAPLNQAYQTLRFDLLSQASRQAKEIKLLATEQGVWLNDHSTSGINEAPHYLIDDLTLQFEPTGFIQVNARINEALVQTALNWLQPNDTQRVLDLFCGIGNFSLPLARRVKQVVGVDLDPQAIAHARANAQRNQLPHATFHNADLFQPIEQQPWWQQSYDIILLDPGRQGAQQICEQLSKHAAPTLLYISCNSSTLIRDLKHLQQHGYRLKKATLFDMFPHTSHYESMVLLERKTH